MAAQPCTVCTHPDRSKIELDWLTATDGQRATAGRWKKSGISRSSLQRHMKEHVAKTAKDAVAMVVARADEQLADTVAHSAALVIETRSEVLAVLRDVQWALAEFRTMASVVADSPELREEKRRALDSIGKMSKAVTESLRLHAQLTGELSPVTTQVAVINSLADWEKDRSLPTETARALIETAEAELSAWQESVTRLGTAEDYAAAEQEGKRRLDAKVAEFRAGGVSGKGGRR